MTVYFARMQDTGLIKIGFSRMVEQRMKELGASLLGSMPGSVIVEQEMHSLWGNLRQGSTELFEPAPELLEFIACLPPAPVSRGRTRINIWIDRKTLHDLAEVLPGMNITDQIATALREELAESCRNKGEAA